MPRDSAGNYSLPAGNPVISGDVITSTWANFTMEDVALALSDSLDRRGRGGMLAPFGFSDGNIVSPGATFKNEPTSGLYRAGAGDVRLSVLGKNKIRAREPGTIEFATADGEWIGVFQLGARNGLKPNLISNNVTAVPGNHYHCVVGGLTITLPDNPEVGVQVGVSTGLDRDNVVLSNGRRLAGVVQDVGMDLERLFLLFQFVGGDVGWQIVSQALSQAVTGGLPFEGNAEGQTLFWNDAESRYEPNDTLTIEVASGTVKGLFSGAGVEQKKTSMLVLAALPGNPDANTLYFIRGVGIYVGADLIAEVNPVTP